MKLLTLAALLVASSALAAEPVICTLTTGTGAATTTAAPTTGTCGWAKGSYILMQCTTDVYVSSSTPTGGQPVTPATSSTELVDFTNNKDKVGLPLNSNDQVISVLAATSGGTCKFMTTLRKKPTAL